MKIRYLFWLVLISIFAVRYVYTRPVYKDGDRVRITTSVRSEPLRYPNSQYLKISGLKTYLPIFPELSYGDNIIVEGTVDNQKGRLKNPSLLNVHKSTNLLYHFRQRLINFYKSSLPQPHSSLIAGVVIGAKQNLPPDFWQSLKNKGLAHVVVASGMNITLVGGFLLNSTLPAFGRKKALTIAVAGIWTYAFVSGFDAPIVRAAIMGTIAFTAQQFGRVNLPLRALFLTAFLMLIVNPSWILDFGFILSFTATLSLILFQTKVGRLIYFVPEFLRQDLATTLAAQIGVAPILYFAFGQLNFLSPVYNLLVLWTIPLITIFGFMGGLIGLIVPEVGRLILFVVYPLTSWFVLVTTK